MSIEQDRGLRGQNARVARSGDLHLRPYAVLAAAHARRDSGCSDQRLTAVRPALRWIDRRRGERALLRYPSSISPLISCMKSMPPSVTVARAGNVSLPFSLPSDRACRTAFSISRWALTPSVLRNFRMLPLKTSSFICRLHHSHYIEILQMNPKLVSMFA